MNEGIKTGVFWCVAVIMIAIAAFASWPRRIDESEMAFIPGTLLFEDFKDPMVASTLQIITFDEERGQLENFEVRKDPASGLWTIPSRDGYPADALDQMRDSANTLVGLKMLDVQTQNAEDHDDLGVKEPKREDLQMGDDGVGRLVVFKDESQETLASLIVGDPVKDDPQKRYVRIPGQDPVYVVKLDVSPLTIRFRDWIEDDLLKLSSIDIHELQIDDYTAAINNSVPGKIDITRRYAATVEMSEGQWSLQRLLDYDPNDAFIEPTRVELGDDQQLATQKLDQINNALDDLKIADVVRKPDGMSANLRADQDLLSDKDAIGSLAARGFYPVPQGTAGGLEILSANGELKVVLNDGVQYIMRFGNIAGVSQGEATAQIGSLTMETGVNRYLLVTAAIDESHFPPPDLQSVPQSVEELKSYLKDEGTDNELEGLTPQELKERLEAEQEKVTKANQRKLDERKDLMETARRRARELNARFADWYYVIPEDTYSVLRVSREELVSGDQG